MAEKKPLTTEEPVNAGLRSTMGERGLLVGQTLSPVSSYLHWFSSPVFLIPYVCSGFLLRVPSVLRFCSLLFASVCPLSSPRVVHPRCPPMLLVLGQPALRWDSCFPSISVFLHLPWSSFPKLLLVLLLEDKDDGRWWWSSKPRR
jgi:hypothetical protein